MKFRYKIATLVAAFSFACSSCASYLDIVPEETAKEKDTYADKNKGLDYLYSCYGYLPNPQDGPNSLDLMTGDEVVTAFEHETFAAFPKGKYSASKPVISYWNKFFKGIRQCYMFLDVVDNLPSVDTTEKMKKDYKAQAKFLIAYYHYQLSICYGPIILIKSTPDINMKATDYPGRSTYDESVKFICDMFDEAAKDLPARRERDSEFGLATSVAAKAFKAKLLLYAASPLFNGNAKFYSDFTDKDGVQLMPTQYDPAKWVKAKTAMKEAIDAAEAAGFALYTKQDYDINNNKFPEGVTRCMRTMILDWQERNPEVIFADPRDGGSYGLQNKSYPYTAVTGAFAWNGVAPTWAMLNRFYTKNGLPWDEDPNFKGEDKLEVVTVGAIQEDQATVGEKTLRFNLDREPRFYAWVSFQGGRYEVKQGEDGVYPNLHKEDKQYYVTTSFLKDADQGRKNRSNNFSPTGYLNKKGCDPTIEVKKSGSQHTNYPWPIIRLADLYLGYAEACVESNDLDNAKVYLNKVRERAGIPTAEKSWEEIAKVTLDQAKLREVVRGERMVEFYLENQNFWDMRRWLLAEKYFGVKAKGLNTQATTINDFAQIQDVPFERTFSSPRNYLLPIPLEDMEKNAKLVNNPGY